jgi:UDP-N-acetylglucosamine 2-epimerase (hydrolysing)
MHILDRYGLTKLEVHRTPGVHVHQFFNQRSGDPQDLIFDKAVTGFSGYLTKHRPDLFVVQATGSRRSRPRSSPPRTKPRTR